MQPIPNTTVGTDWTTFADGGIFYGSGFLFVFNATVEIEMKTWSLGGAAQDWSAPVPAAPGIFPIVAGAPSPQRPSPEFIFGLRVRQLVGSSPTTAPQVFGALFQPGEAQVLPGAALSSTLSAQGNVTPGTSSVLIQHNGTSVASEPTIDFVDGTSITWTVADDAPNTRVTVTPAGGGLPIVSDSTLLGTAASVDITGIAATYKHLLLEVQARSDNAGAGFVACRFNADAGANYNDSRISVTTAASSIAGATGATSMRIGNCAASADPAGDAPVFSCFIPNYAGTTFRKAAVSTGRYIDASTILIGGDWLSTAAVNRITLFPDAGSFIAGTRVTLYGLG